MSSIPETISVLYEDDVCLSKCLNENTAQYLRTVLNERFDMNQEAKFAMSEIQHVECIKVDGLHGGYYSYYDDDEEEEEDDGFEWGVMLRVTLASGKFFLLYMPFDGYELHDNVYECGGEIYESINVLEPDADIKEAISSHAGMTKRDYTVWVWDSEDSTERLSIAM